MFPEDLTPDRLHTFWVGVWKEAGLPGLCIHDTRHTWVSQGVMNGIGLTTVGRLLGHRRRRTTAIYAHLDDAAQAAAVIARAMEYRAKATPPVTEESLKEMAEESFNVPDDAGDGDGSDSDESTGGDLDMPRPVRKGADEPTDLRRGPTVPGKAVDSQAKRREPETPARGVPDELSGGDTNPTSGIARCKGWIPI